MLDRAEVLKHLATEEDADGTERQSRPDGERGSSPSRPAPVRAGGSRKDVGGSRKDLADEVRKNAAMAERWEARANALEKVLKKEDVTETTPSLLGVFARKKREQLMVAFHEEAKRATRTSRRS